jgi:hypothetical protein
MLFNIAINCPGYFAFCMGVPRDLGVAVSGIAPTRQFIQHDIPVYGLKRKALTINRQNIRYYAIFD